MLGVSLCPSHPFIHPARWYAKVETLQFQEEEEEEEDNFLELSPRPFSRWSSEPRGCQEGIAQKLAQCF